MIYLKWNERYLLLNERITSIDAITGRLAKIKTDLVSASSKQIACAREPSEVSEAEALESEMLYFAYEGDPALCKSAYAVTAPCMLDEPVEGPHQLRKSGHNCLKLNDRYIRAVNINEPGFWRNFNPEPLIYTARRGKSIIEKKRVHILALGDVGCTLLLGIKLLGGHLISSIGIYDISPDMMQRLEYEMNQMYYPDAPDSMPAVDMISEEQMFDCDVFVFCASKGVPPVGTNTPDVRMAQLAENKKIISKYADMADQKGFKGIFAVVSDPVDQLCRSVLFQDAADGQPEKRRANLRPEQIKGYGLGVMHSRGIYYARQDERLRSYLTRGRCFGPHGKGLLLVNDIERYDTALSDELTSLALNANLKTRETGFKPYLAPAIASGAISILLTLEGKWHYSSNFLGGVYMGARNRILPSGLEIEQIPMCDALYTRILETYNSL